MELDEKITFNGHTYSGRTIDVVHSDDGAKESLLFFEEALGKAVSEYFDDTKKIENLKNELRAKFIDEPVFGYIPESVLKHDDKTVLTWCLNHGFDVAGFEPANEVQKELTWDDIYVRAEGTAGIFDNNLKAKDNAREYITGYAKEHFGIDIEAAEIPEETIDNFLKEHPELDRFDETGRMLIEEIERKQSKILEKETMDMARVIAKIEWTVQDVADAFSDKYGRKPTEKELDVLLENLNTEGMEEKGIEAGWDGVNDAVYESRTQINDMTKTESERMQNTVCEDFEITKEDLSSLIGEIKESNKELTNRELNEEIAFRLIEKSVDMHGFESQLGGKAVFEHEANPDNKAVISEMVNSQIMEAHSTILEEAANAYVSGDIKFNALQDFIDERLKANELYKGFEKTGVLTDFVQEHKEPEQNGNQSRIYSFSPFGYEGSLVTIETDLRRGIPAYDIVGIFDGAVKETRERIRAAIINSGLNLSSNFDLL